MTKKFVSMVLFCLCGIFLLGGCAAAEKETVYTVTMNYREYLVDTEAETITYGGNVYEYEITGNRKNSGTVSIRFPDGPTYTESWSYHNGMGSATGSWNGEYTMADHQRAQELLRVLEEESPYKEGSSGKQVPLLVSILLIVVGVFMLLAPEAAWKLNIGWQFKNAEPSQAALTFTGVAGIVVLVIGVVTLFF